MTSRILGPILHTAMDLPSRKRQRSPPDETETTLEELFASPEFGEKGARALALREMRERHRSERQCLRWEQQQEELDEIERHIASGSLRSISWKTFRDAKKEYLVPRILNLLCVKPHSIRILNLHARNSSIINQVVDIVAQKEGPSYLALCGGYGGFRRGPTYRRLVSALGSSSCLRRLDLSGLYFDLAASVQVVRNNKHIVMLMLPSTLLDYVSSGDPDLEKLTTAVCSNQSLRHLGFADGNPRFMARVIPKTLSQLADMVRRCKWLISIKLPGFLPRGPRVPTKEWCASVVSIYRAAAQLGRMYNLLVSSRLTPYFERHAISYVLSAPNLNFLDDYGMQSKLNRVCFARLPLRRRCFAVALVHDLELSLLSPTQLHYHMAERNRDMCAARYESHLRDEMKRERKARRAS